jgi:hypothetical protein
MYSEMMYHVSFYAFSIVLLLSSVLSPIFFNFFTLLKLFVFFLQFSFSYVGVHLLHANM